jgi:hypothetical protein
MYLYSITGMLTKCVTSVIVSPCLSHKMSKVSFVFTKSRLYLITTHADVTSIALASFAFYINTKITIHEEKETN